MTTAKLTGAILLTLEDKQIWVDEIEVEPAPTQLGTLLWYVHEGKRHVLYLDGDGEPVGEELIEYIHSRDKPDARETPR